jgi:hypothetical protein
MISLRTLLLPALLGLVACSGVPVGQDYDSGIDFSRYHGYRWDAATAAKESTTENNDPLMNRRIHEAVDRVLAARGYTQAGDKADFVVSYQTVVQGRTVSEGTSSSVSFGFGSFGHFGGIGIVHGDSIGERDEATLIIDVIDAGSGKLAWRGTSARYLSRYDTPEELTETVNRHVDAILAQFPPGRQQ